MKLIGHVSSAVLVATPLILYRQHIPLDGVALRSGILLWWVGLFAALPDLDIMLSRWTPIKHRGFASHSLLTVLLTGLAVLGCGALLQGGVLPPDVARILAPANQFLTPFAAMLAALSVLVHLLGDAMTKTGVPLFWPERMWHIPIIGGQARFDSWWLNAIPLAGAAYVVITVFGYDPQALKHLGHWRDVLAQK